ncbi:MAG: hypothetical protein RR791_02820 [Lachnospiraceae bacterium]
MEQVCGLARHEICNHNYEQIEGIIAFKMGEYPDSAIPHNLMGILLQKQNHHVAAMKHFRAAYALDPTYIPARYNMDLYTNFYPKGEGAYVESDCKEMDKMVMLGGQMRW